MADENTKSFPIKIGRYVIHRKTKTVWHRNPISGHVWSTDVPVKGFEVSGGKHFTTSHGSFKGAMREVEDLIALDRRLYA